MVYNDACKWLRLKHQVYGTELKKNIIERFIQKIKDRTQNVLMTIFHVDQKVVIDSIYQLDQDVYSVFTYENRQN